MQASSSYSKPGSSHLFSSAAHSIPFKIASYSLLLMHPQPVLGSCLWSFGHPILHVLPVKHVQAFSLYSKPGSHIPVPVTIRL